MRIGFSLEEDPRDFITLCGGGNFGDLYRGDQKYRTSIIEKHPNSTFVLFPQSVFYNDISLVKQDRTIYEGHNIYLTFRQKESLDFMREHFPRAKIYGIPDAAFYIGDVEKKVTNKPNFHILILTRLHFEVGGIKNYNQASYWKEAKEFLNEEKITFKITDWPSNPYRGSEPNKIKRSLEILDLAIEVISEGQILITDALHGSILGVLANKPHVYIDNGYSKVTGTRKFAFKNKEECDEKYLRSQFALRPLDAVKIAAKMLKNNFFID